LSAIAAGGINAAQVATGGTCTTQTPIAPGANCSITVTVTPGTIGAFAATLFVNSNAANGAATISVQGNGTAASPSGAANRTAIAFGAHTVGAAAAIQNVIITNTGPVSLTLAPTVNGSPAMTLGAGTTCGATLAVAASCHYEVGFAPAAAGVAAASLDIATNAATIQVPVTGVGSLAAQPTPVWPNAGPLVFADTAVGQVSAARTVTLTNGGTAALSITSIAASGVQADAFLRGGTCSATSVLNPAASCTFEFRFAPAVGGSNSGRITVTLGNGATLEVDLTGTATVPVGAQSVMVQPSSQNFGGVVIGHAASTRRVTLTNNGSSPITLQSAVVSGPFSAAATGCMAVPYVLAPGASCDVTLSYVTPGSVGASSGSLLLTAADGQGSWNIALSGQVTPAQSNQGGGGCSAIQSARDPLLPAMAIVALVVLAWRRRRKHANKDAA
jgi:hypothetical protein